MMDVTKVCRSNLLEPILEDLRYKIICKVLIPGEFLVEEALAEEYNASRGSIRTVLSFLEQEGLIEVLGNGRKKVHGFSEQDVLTHWDLRIYLECTAAQCILSNYAQYINSVSSIISKITSDIPLEHKLDAESSIAIDMEIHRSLVVSVNNRLLINTWNNLSHIQETLMRLNTKDWYQAEYIGTLRESHMPVFLALLQGKQDAVALLSEHIGKAKDISLEAFRSMRF